METKGANYCKRLYIRLLLLVVQPQLCPDMARLTRGECDWSGDGLVTLKVIQRERLIES